jgi:hypothetical protein
MHGHIQSSGSIRPKAELSKVRSVPRYIKLIKRLGEVHMARSEGVLQWRGICCLDVQLRVIYLMGPTILMRREWVSCISWLSDIKQEKFTRIGQLNPRFSEHYQRLKRHKNIAQCWRQPPIGHSSCKCICVYERSIQVQLTIVLLEFEK